MTDIDVSGSTFTAAEEAFFESGGTTDLNTGTEVSAADQGNQSEQQVDQATGGENKDATGTDKADKYVPLGALQEERGKRKASDQKVRDLETQVAELRGKFSVIDRISGNGQQGQQQEAAAALTPETDIFGFVKKTGETVQEVLTRLDKQDQERKAADEDGKVVSNYRTDAAQFESKTPDFRQAYGYLLSSRAQELMAFGVTDEAAIRSALEGEELQIAKIAFQHGKSPSEVIYTLAQQRGYKKVDAVDKKPGAEEKIEAIERGQAASKSLSATGGSAGADNVTAAELVRMPLDEFTAWCEKNPAKAKRLMGG